MTPNGKRRHAVPHLLVVPTCAPAEAIGLHEVPGRLPRIDRLPGESFGAMLHRAMWAATGDGPFLAFLRARGQVKESSE